MFPLDLTSAKVTVLLVLVAWLDEYVVYPDGLVLLYGVYPNAPVTLADVIALV